MVRPLILPIKERGELEMRQLVLLGIEQVGASARKPNRARNAC